MLTHAAINARFAALDLEPAMLATAFDGWLAWPIVKERLWLVSLASVSGRPGGSGRSLRSALGRLASGSVQIAGGLLRPGRTPVALLYDSRDVVLPEGGAVHPHLGRFAVPEDPTRLHYLYSWGGHGGRGAGARTLRDHDIGAVTAALARAVRGNRRIAAVAASLAPPVVAACPELAPALVSVLLQDQLARFRCRHALFRRLYRRRQVRAVVVLDPDGKVPEVAAAKSLGLPVVEVQHGMFGTQEPDYSWSVAHRAAAAPMPVADTVVVFGPLWRDALVRAGYWDADSVRQAASPVVGAFRRARAAGYRPPPAGTPLRLLFASQGYVRDHALGFWREALRLQAHRPLFRLRIKVHPMELADREAYDRLAAQFPDACTVVSAAEATYPEMLAADVVAGYTSLMLVEAIGMGIPTLGIRGGAADEGLIATFGAAGLANVLDEVASPEALLARVEAGSSPSELAAWGARTAAGSTLAFDIEGPSVESVLSTLTAGAA